MCRNNNKMTRKELETINSDYEVTNLRMQAEDLINNMDMMNKEEFETESKRLKEAIDERLSFLYNELKK